MSKTIIMCGLEPAPKLKEKNFDDDNVSVELLREQLGFPSGFDFGSIYSILLEINSRTEPICGDAAKGSDFAIAAVRTVLGFKKPKDHVFDKPLSQLWHAPEKERAAKEKQSILAGHKIPKPFIFSEKEAAVIEGFETMFSLICMQLGLKFRLPEIGVAPSASRILDYPETNMSLIVVPEVQDLNLHPVITYKDTKQHAVLIDNGSISETVRSVLKLPE